MCIIAVKQKKVPMFGNDILKRMFQKNPDGAGIAWQKAGESVIHVCKGLMKFKQLKSAIKKADIKTGDLLIVHCRIATSGGVNQSMCHPFKVTSNVKQLKSLEFTTKGLVMAHNGVLFTPGGSDLSDTAVFVRDIASSPVIRNNLTNPAVADLIEGYIGSDKLVFIHPKRKPVFFGAWIEEKGVKYSNNGYKKPDYRGSYMDAWDWDSPYSKTSNVSKAKSNSYGRIGLVSKGYHYKLECDLCKSNRYCRWDAEYSMYVCRTCDGGAGESKNAATTIDKYNASSVFYDFCDKCGKYRECEYKDGKYVCDKCGEGQAKKAANE